MKSLVPSHFGTDRRSRNTRVQRIGLLSHSDLQRREDPLQFSLVLFRWANCVHIDLCHPDPGVQGFLDESNGRIVGHGVEIVLSPAVHARRDEVGRENVDGPADVRYVIQDQLEQLITLLFRQGLRVIHAEL